MANGLTRIQNANAQPNAQKKAPKKAFKGLPGNTLPKDIKK